MVYYDHSSFKCLWSFLLTLFFRLLTNAAHYFDWKLRLCSLDGCTYDDPCALECKLQGVYSQLSCRNAFLLKFSAELCDSREKYRGNVAILDVQRSTSSTLLSLQMSMLSAAFLSLKVCCDPLPLKKTIQLCSHHLPTVLASSCAKETSPSLLLYLQRLLHGLSALYALEKQRPDFSRAIDGTNAMSLPHIQSLMSSLAGIVLRLTRMEYLDSPFKSTKCPALLALHETVFISYSSACYSVVVTLERHQREGFLAIHGFASSAYSVGAPHKDSRSTLRELLQLIRDAVVAIREYTSSLACVVLYTQTILSLYSCLEICHFMREEGSSGIAAEGHPLECQRLLEDLRTQCQQLLSSVSSRYLLAQILLDQCTALEPSSQAPEPC